MNVHKQWTERYRELDRMRKPSLVTHFLSLGTWVAGVHPRQWSKEEVIRSILDCEGLGYTPNLARDPNESPTERAARLDREVDGPRDYSDPENGK